MWPNVFRARIQSEVGSLDRIDDVDFGKKLPGSAQVLNADGVIA